ncbi:MAG: D-aminoacyl-tRNA deacylase [Oscillospiraceae bacterium]
MRALIQRVTRASVQIEKEETRAIGPGLLILLGVKDTDTTDICAKLAEKCAGLRIFEDEEGKMNLSAQQLGYSALVVSNFTLYADTKKGKRPSFTAAAAPALGDECYKLFVQQLSAQGLKEVKTGEFGADMQIELVNDGPVTIMIDTDEWKNS